MKVVKIVILVVTAFIWSHCRAYDFKVDGFCYNVLSKSEHTVEVTFESIHLGEPTYNFISGDLLIPEIVSYNENEYKVTAIGSCAFYMCKSITGTLTISNSVKSIEDYAFQGCSGLTGSLTIPNSVTCIGKYAFQGCSGFTGTLTIPSSVTSIEDYAFQGCSGLTGSLTIPNSVTSIGKYAFQGCSGFTGTLAIPNSVSSIADATFGGCSGFTGSLIIPNSVASIGKWGFSGCSGFTGPLTIPSSVTSIEDYAFHGCLGFVGSLEIPNSVTSIGDCAFQGCSGLTGSLTIPNTVTSIGNSAFTGCSGFTGTLTIPSSVKSIEDYAFQGCSGLTGSLTIPNSVTSIGKYAFQGCSGFTGSLTIPNSVTSIGSSAFSGCSGFSGSLTIPNLVTSIGISAFTGCSGFTGSLTISNSVTSIGSNTFSGCSGFSGSLTMPNSVTTIGDGAFEGCSGFNGSLTIPNSVQSIGKCSFKDCSNLTGSLTIPNSVSFIGYGAFWGCSGFTDSLRLPNSIEYINDYTFYYCSGLAGNLEIPNSVISIGDNAFYYCTNFKGCLTIPNSVTSIGRSAFYNCYGFSGSLIIPNSVKSIGNGAFQHCSGFTGPLVLSNSLTSIGDLVFSGCNGFTGTLTIPNSVISIGAEAFRGCTGFSGSLTLPNSLKSIDSRAFFVCSGLTGSLTIPNSLKSMGEYVFYGLSKIDQVYSEIQNPFNLSLGVFKEISPKCVLYVPVGTKQMYQESTGWKDYFSEIEEYATRKYELMISPLGNGYVTFLESTFGGVTNVFSVYEGTSVTLTFLPKSGFCVGSLQINGVDVTSAISNNQYTITSCKENTTVNVVFEEIPPVTYTLSITSSGSGSVNYSGFSISDDTKSFSVNEGTSAMLNVQPNDGYQVKSLKMNGADITPYISNNQYTINDIHLNITVSVEFEAIPPTTYMLSITSSSDGSVIYNGNTISGTTQSFTVTEGESVTLNFTPDARCQVGSLKVDGVDVTSDISGNQYTINNISGNTEVFATFEEKVIPDGSVVAYEGVNYRVVSGKEKTVNVTIGEYAHSLDIPATIVSDDVTLSVSGMDVDVLMDNPQLAAVIWNPAVRFDAKVSNPNFLLYVTSADYAPSGIKNVIVNGTAGNITLTEADGGNDFYCPKAFAARSISYTHNYSMETGVGECRGWETIALPFNVQKIIHSDKGQVVPFAVWQKGETRRPFWLYELTGNGWKEAGAINAYTPYVISMPNNELYYESSCLNGQVTFSAENVAVEATTSHKVSYNGKTFVPNFSVRESSGYVYALNVKNDWATYNGSLAEGSHFVQNLRTVHPFEAYMTTENNARAAFSIFDDDATEVQGVKMLLDQRKIKGIYNLNGQKLDEDYDRKLPAGVYIIDGQKVMVK